MIASNIQAKPQEIRTPKKSAYRPEIDGLRAFAVIAVIINHFNQDALPGGYLGVDIFFVISGYVITSSLSSRTNEGFKDFLSGFYERRIKRLIPALSAFVLITSIAICLFNPSPDTSIKTGITSLFGLSNLYLLKQSTDYFSQSTELNPFTQTWSLGVEEQFYILFPLLIWLSGFGRQTKNGARNLFLVVGALTIASLISFLYLYPTNQPAAYFLMPSRFWEMATGCLIFIGFQKRATLEQLLERVPPLAALTLIVAVMYLPISIAETSTIAVVALSCILIASLKKQTAAFQILSNPQVVYIGLISYSLYLWHWGILSISRWTIGIHIWTIPIQIALMLTLSIASYQWIESPLRKKAWFEERWKTLLTGITILALTSLTSFSATKGSTKQLLEMVRDRIYPEKFNIDEGIPQESLYCHLPNNIDTALSDCLINPTHKTNKANTIYLVGDSHATNHYWSISSAIKKSNLNYNLNTLAENGFINYLQGGSGCLNKESCINNAERSYKSFLKKHLTQDDLVFISLARDRFTLGKYKGSPRQQNTPRVNKLEERLLELSAIIKKSGAKLILIGDIPKVCPEYINYQHFIMRLGNVDICNTLKSTSLADRAGLNNALLRVARESPSTIYVDPHNEFCIENSCGVLDHNGDLIYSDKSPHLSKANKNYLLNYWVNALKDLKSTKDSSTRNSSPVNSTE